MDRHDVSESFDVFLSYSRNDLGVATNLMTQLERRGLVVFRDQEKIRAGDLWLNKLQDAVTACGSFVLLIGQDGVRRWIGAETQVALGRYFGPHDDAERLPIFPILLGDTAPEALPAFLGLFQGTRWNGTDPLPESLLDQIAERRLKPAEAVAFEGCPFVGLDAYTPEQAGLFFGRQQETLDALACFDQRPGAPAVRWLEINGNSGCGKSSLMNAGLLPLVDQGWLWPRTGFESWRRIGPMLPGKHPVGAMAERLARAFKGEMADVRRHLEADERGLADWLRSRKPDDDTAFLLAVDQFEELFTFADPTERTTFDQLLATAIDDPDCPLFVVSTVRADFLDRLEELPRLLAVRNRLARPWTLPLVSDQGLREIVTGPARLAGLDVSEVRELIVAEARDEPGALPLVQNALLWLWNQRTPDGRLCRDLLSEHGGLAGVLSERADALLDGLGRDRHRALDLLFELVNVDPEGQRHTRRRLPLTEAIAMAGGEPGGRELVSRLAGQRELAAGKKAGPLRLVTISGNATEAADADRWVDLIHETLVRRKPPDTDGKMRPYWPTLWDYIDANKDRAARREHLKVLARSWDARRGLGRLFGLAGLLTQQRFRGLAPRGSIEHRYIRWSGAKSAVLGALALAVLGVVAESLLWNIRHGFTPQAGITRLLHQTGLRPVPLPEMVQIPPNGEPLTFTRGSETSTRDDERPTRTVTFPRPFEIGATEVTAAQYAAFTQATGRSVPRGAGAFGWWESEGPLPVVDVTWLDARDYAAWFGAMTGRTCRLPSEAEWEFACRAGKGVEYPWGDDFDPQKANTREAGRRQPTAAGTYPANPWGLYDMSGNVWEWTLDHWYDYTGAPIDGSARIEEGEQGYSPRVLRGGSWDYDRGFARCASRFYRVPSLRNSVFGFRVVCSSPS